MCIHVATLTLKVQQSLCGYEDSASKYMYIHVYTLYM